MATAPPDDFTVEWPTLWVMPDWIERHCPIPDGFRKGQVFELYKWQLWCTVNHYRINPAARLGQLSTAFFYRRSQVIAPQKCGKGPWSASVIAGEAVGPAVFYGWAEGGEVYDCRQWGCPCGWTYAYEAGEPMGRPWPTPLIQLTATSSDQTDNVYRPLQSMIRNGPLQAQMKVGEGFIRLPNDGLIEVVTSSARSRLGNPITFVLHDESGMYLATNGMHDVATTQRRGVAGMGGRSMETTNAYAPDQDSTAQRTQESRVRDVFKFWHKPPAGLSFANKAERRRIFRHVYSGSKHVDLDAIESECAEIMEKDPAQAERFFGNRAVAGHSSWLDGARWGQRAVKHPRTVARRTRVVLGFDGSDVDDWTAFRAETMDGYQFTPTFADGRPCIWNPADHNGQVPRLEVSAALDELMKYFSVVRMYPDPPYWDTECDEWIDKYGDRVIIPWHTRRIVQMHAAAERLRTDVVKKDTTFSHDGCEVAEAHVRNTRTAIRPGGKYVLVKASAHQKIDVTVTSILAHEALCDVVAAGMATQRSYAYTA
jgi:hypothetical protein